MNNVPQRIFPSVPSRVASSGNDIVVQVEGLRKRYLHSDVVRDLHFCVHRGEVFGLIGPDGAGKTSTFHMLAGILNPCGGRINILGRPSSLMRQHIGYVTQRFSLYEDLSIDENLRYCAGVRSVSLDRFANARDHYLAITKLDRFSKRLARDLSGGMKQKLALCCALIGAPDVLLLDEPTVGVDPVSRRDFWDVLLEVADGGMTILVATPYFDEAERCHRIALMHGGVIQALDTPQRLKDSLKLQRLVVRGPQLEKIEAVITREASVSCIQDVQWMGDHLDLMVHDASAARAELQRIGQSCGLYPSVTETTAPTLENLVILRLRQSDPPPPVLPFPMGPTEQQLTGQFEAQESRVIPAVEVQNLTRRFGSFVAVNELNLAIQRGEIYGLLGANGAGKTTTIKMLCGLMLPSEGVVHLHGIPLIHTTPEIRTLIGYMSQKFTLYDDLTVLENLEFYCGVHDLPPTLGRRRIAWVLESCGLHGKEHLPTGQLPGGWKQRVAFGAAVIHQPSILFLDEPTSGVDALARRQLWKMIHNFASAGTAVIVTTHYLEEAEHCHRLGIMVDGTLMIQGPPAFVKRSRKGQMMEVVPDGQHRRCYSVLKRALDPWRVSLFGDRLHVLVGEATQASTLAELLSANHIALLSLEPIPFSLEDVFIDLVRREWK
jgi:ABC-2 type transport system ATP-binding protein